MSFEEMVAADANILLNDDVTGFAETVYIRKENNAAKAIFLDSWEEDQDPRKHAMIISAETFEQYQISHRDLIYRVENSITNQTFEVKGYRPEPDGSVYLELGSTDELFAVSR